MLKKIEHVEDKVGYYTDLALSYATEYGLKLLGALAIFFIGKWIVRKIVMLMRRAMERSRVDETLISFAGNALSVALMIAVIVAAASNLGINTTSFVAVFGAAGLAIGLALKDTLSNVGAAVLIIFFRPFKVGDFIETAGVMGTVKTINLFSTTLTTTDNRSIIIPNGALISGNIINYTGNETRRIDMVFDIDYKDDLKLAKTVILEILEAHPKVLQEPEPLVAVGALAQNSVQIVARPWVHVDDYWNTMFEVTEAVKEAFDRNRITVPFPQMVTHVVQEGEK
ncbi:mechanosensitive ion channel [Sulfuricurvum sp. IAE1]|jgi:small conductance mechanosensitive channel|uniref:mechanosensitive ion channel family protein n=1 Tax=Sulfuricurvum sp. IAE1 TaxID=2546102 RepID=UPI00104A3C1C|nr:mechanosensitive ion channel domain-containing protein [Sulfuricurvum sp. IAE1]MDD3770756.1 mechanosensitive ion channel [Sulfuricurvum sp.]MDX9965861.1 mechanosensitive ion channel [Sulfuricurvum sp.]TDA68443.1 mechanosensitive ion channel [Sulfuricurvum sp. IAE1]